MLDSGRETSWEAWVVAEVQVQAVLVLVLVQAEDLAVAHRDNLIASAFDSNLRSIIAT